MAQRSDVVALLPLKLFSITVNLSEGEQLEEAKQTFLKLVE